jgi:hypothetical protein
MTYVVNIRVFSGFDGVLIEPEEEVEQQLKQILKQIEEADPKELEKDVYEEFTIVLCRSCRDRFVDETQHPWEGPFRFRKDLDKMIH